MNGIPGVAAHSMNSLSDTGTHSRTPFIVLHVMSSAQGMIKKLESSLLAEAFSADKQFPIEFPARDETDFVVKKILNYRNVRLHGLN